jgi:hypothetical protein
MPATRALALERTVNAAAPPNSESATPDGVSAREASDTELSRASELSEAPART